MNTAGFDTSRVVLPLRVNPLSMEYPGSAYSSLRLALAFAVILAIAWSLGHNQTILTERIKAASPFAIIALPLAWGWWAIHNLSCSYPIIILQRARQEVVLVVPQHVFMVRRFDPAELCIQDGALGLKWECLYYDSDDETEFSRIVACPRTKELEATREYILQYMHSPGSGIEIFTVLPQRTMRHTLNKLYALERTLFGPRLPREILPLLLAENANLPLPEGVRYGDWCLL